MDLDEISKLPLDQQQARARLAHKALVVNIGASWCGPCKLLKVQVLSKPTVKSALRGVIYTHYDAEVGVGTAAARALSVHGFPTLVALAQDGAEISRIQGVPSAEGLERWLGKVAAESAPTAALEAQVQKDPSDARALLVLAQRYKKRGDRERAKQSLTRARDASVGKDERVAASADWGLRMDHLQTVLREEPRQAMIEHLLRYPKGPMADTAVNALSRLGAADDKARRAFASYVDAHLSPGQEEVLNQGIYACLRAAAFDEAERAARHLLAQRPDSAMYLDTLAEVLHLRGDSQGALRISAQAVASAQNDPTMAELRAELLRNQERFRRGKREPPADLIAEDDSPMPWEAY